MVESLPVEEAGTQKRRSTRIVQAIPITVAGVDALGQPFKERTTTVMVNCHGCKYQSKHYVPKNSTITLEIPRSEPPNSTRTVTGKVIWVQRPRAVRELFQIGLEFEVSGNAWGIAFPPEDWFPCPGEGTAESEKKAVSTAQAHAPEKKAETPAPFAFSPEHPAASAAPPPPTSPVEAKIHVVPDPAPSPGAQLVSAQQSAKLIQDAKETLEKTLRKGAETAINEEMTFVRQQLDAQMHEAVERAIKVSMERVSESTVKKVVQQAADRTSAIVEDARKASEANAENLDAKVRQAVDLAVSGAVTGAVSEAMSGAVESAAQQAAQRVAANDLKQAVDEAVERVVSQREMLAPATSVFSSPEAAQQHLDQWKANLEETAADVRSRTIEQAHAEAEAARQRWSDEFQISVAGATHSFGDRLTEASQSALSQTAQELAARQSEVRNSLDEAIASAQNTIQSVAGGLEQERMRTEDARQQLAESAREAIEQTRRNLDDILVEQKGALAQQVDQMIAERSQLIEPLLESSAQKAAERFSIQLDEKLASGLDAAQRAAAGLAQAREQAAQAHITIIEQVREAGEQGSRIQTVLRDQVQEAATHAAQIQTAIRDQIKHASDEAAERASGIQTALRDQVQETAAHAAQIQASVRDQIKQVSDEAAERASGIQTALRDQVQETAAHAAQIQASVRDQIKQASDEAAERASNIQTTLRDRVQETTAHAAQIQASVRDQIKVASDEAAERVSGIQAALRDQAQETAAHAAQVQEGLREQIQQSSTHAEQIRAGLREQIHQASEEAAQIQSAVRDRVQRTSEETIQESLARLRQESAKVPAEFEESIRTTLSKIEGEFEQRSTEAQHETYEALTKAADWYQKKAQTTMQTALDKTVDQSTSSLRGRAAEITSRVASELDHYRRSYLEHSQAEIEEAAKEIVSKEQAKLGESAEMVHASFTDRVHGVTSDSLRTFDEASRQALEKARSDMEYSREGSLSEFQKTLDEKMTQSVEHASTFLQSQLGPLIETLQASRDAQQKQWMEQLRKSTEDSIEQYKARLENTSNSWLLASATTLGQHSQTVLDTLAKAAEKRMKESVAGVLANMGDTLKDRLLGISSDLGAESAADDDTSTSTK